MARRGRPPPDRRSRAAWLQALVWPEHTDRAERLALALAAASSDPPRVVTADFVTGLRNLLEAAPSGLPVVVTHSAALAYAPLAVREEVLAVCSAAGAVRIGLEGRAVLPDLRGLLPEDVVRGSMVVSVDDEAVALAHPHGRWVRGL